MLSKRIHSVLATAVLLFTLATDYSVTFGVDWRVGVAKSDITPREPIRLSGYANRSQPFESVADPLHARAMVILEAEKEMRNAVVIVSVDSIAVTAPMTIEVAKWTEEKFGVPRSQLVLCSSHSHAAPHIHGGLNNLFTTPLAEEEKQKIQSYTSEMIVGIKRSIEAAFATLKPAGLSIATTTAGFAMQRRAIRSGKWAGFGETADGAVDRRVRVLQCHDLDGKIIGAAYMYACHCTTLGDDFNQVSGDWAGLSANRLEQLHPGAVFLPVIGCGADANPKPRTGYNFAEQHAAELISSVQQALNGARSPITEPPQVHFGHAGLAPEQPNQDFIDRRATSTNANQRAWAEHMKATRAAMGRLPETVPMPIHTWRFGDQLTWVFLGGEVVSEYQLAIEKRLGGEVWVAAYVDDVFAYVASERMRAEGGYEVDDSMIYYLQPGRWQAGTQELIERRVTELLNETQAEGEPLSSDKALLSIRVPPGFRAELIAHEPMVQDPINIAFGIDGSAWVVEMADYPLGGPEGGRIKRLRDTDGDGKLDASQTFLSGLSYPTSVFPWRDGVLYIAAPNVVFARDSNGDGTADEQEILLSGIAESNPQHRSSGFAVGIDGWLHFTAGESTKELTSTRAKQTYQVAHHDIAWNPDTGEVRPTVGETQFIRARDDFGNWFGNSNSLPIYHFVIDSRYQKEASIAGESIQHLLTPAVAPPVFPRSRTVDRFNDLFAFNRFTSACSSMIIRTPGLGKEMQGAALVCEPVHNLVARFEVESEGGSFVGKRFDADKEFDFFTSTDPFCRPVRAVNAPDGTLWILDMSRQVIEHPEWIPTAWQERLNVRSGENLGRIYRIYHESFRPYPISTFGKDTSNLSAAQLLSGLTDENAAVRELALLYWIWNKPKADPQKIARINEALHKTAQGHPNSAIRVTALGLLLATNELTDADIASAFECDDPRVVRVAIELAEPQLQTSPELRKQFIALVKRNRGSQVDLQWLLTSLSLPPQETADSLATLAERSLTDRWIIRSLALCRDPLQCEQLCRGILVAANAPEGLQNQLFAEVQQTLNRLWTRVTPESRGALLQKHFATESSDSKAAMTPSQLLLITAYGQSREAKEDAKLNLIADEVIRQVAQNSLSRMQDFEAPEGERLALINLLGCDIIPIEQAMTMIAQLIDARQLPSIQEAALLAARRLNSPIVATTLVETWPKMTPEARLVASATMLTRKAWVNQLLTALEQDKIRTVDLDAATIQQLTSYGDRSIRNRCEAVFGKPSSRAAVVARYMQEMPKEGDVARGEKLFTENCAVCHRPPEGKSMIGPPIDNLGHWNIEQWVTAIMDPNRAIEPKFHQYTVLTDDGQVLAGVIQQRSAQSVRLASADGSQREVTLESIEEIRDSGVSLMPEGLETKLSPADLAALIAFLRSR